MNFISAALFILLIAVLAVPFANRARMPLEIFLFLGSCLMGLMPGLPTIQLEPTIVFEIFLPPILFSAAYFTSWSDFKLNLRPILQMAFGLVIFTALVVAITVKHFFPDFTWAEAFLLGAIVSPTDATAATSIVRKLNAPRRLIILLEGESLVNDATALMLYRFSLAAILYNSFSFTNAAFSFVGITLGGIAIGLIIAFLTAGIAKRLDHSQAETVLSMLTAFGSYLIAERLGCSGVIATVVAGIYYSLKTPEFTSSQAKVNAKASWGTLLFAINGLVFTLIGLELPTVLTNLGEFSVQKLLVDGVLISGIIILARIIWFYPSAYLPRKLFKRIAEKDPMPSWKLLFTLGWCGMRGIVSLAAAVAIPHYLIRGTDSHHVDIIVFLTYCVVVITLLLPSLTLPWLLKLFGLNSLSELHQHLREEARVRLHAIDTVIKEIIDLRKQTFIPETVVTDYLEQLERNRQVIHTQVNPSPYSMVSAEYIAYKKLVMHGVDAERKTLNQLRREGDITDEVYWHLSDELDIEELRARGVRI